jgi:hypothetical protein
MMSCLTPVSAADINHTIGNQYPIGATFITQKLIYPALIGNDIVRVMTKYDYDSCLVIKKKKALF